MNRLQRRIMETKNKISRHLAGPEEVAKMELKKKYMFVMMDIMNKGGEEGKQFCKRHMENMFFDRLEYEPDGTPNLEREEFLRLKALHYKE